MVDCFVSSFLGLDFDRVVLSDSCKLSLDKLELVGIALHSLIEGSAPLVH